MACKTLCLLLSRTVQIELPQSAKQHYNIEKSPYSAVVPYLIWRLVFIGQVIRFEELVVLSSG
jgi:hypothetical protein